MAECDAVSEICDSNRLSGKKNKDSTEIKKTCIFWNYKQKFEIPALL